MQMKRIIISADDFGYSEENNEAILIGYKEGNITSAGLMSNMSGFYNAVEEIIPQIPDIDLGFHFNIAEGKSLTNPKLLCNNEGYFNKGFLSIFLNQKNDKLLSEIEIEFRAQIERILQYTSISHIDSHMHIHAIPNIFNIIVKLAKEYNIKFIRTQKEIPYIVSEKIINKRFPVNIVKSILLNTLTSKNIINIKDIKTNNNIIGVLYTGYMNEETIYNGLKAIKDKEGIIEIIIHPYLPKEIGIRTRMNNYREFLITKTPKLREKIKDLGGEYTKYSEL